MNEDGRPKGFGFVDFTSNDEAAAAVEFNGSDMDGRSISVDFATVKNPKASTTPRTGGKFDPTPKPAGCTSVFVGNLSWNVDDNMLYECFSSCGGIISARVSKDKETGQPKGYEFIALNCLVMTKKQAQQS